MLKALIFDVDGTLSETEDVHRRAFNEIFDAAGIGWHWSRMTYRRLLAVTGGKERMCAWRSETGSGPDDAAIVALHLRKTERYGEMIAAGGAGLRPGIAELVALARSRGLHCAIATTTNRPNVDVLVRAAWGRPAEEVFDVIAAGDEVAAKKPAPDVYLQALRQLGVTAPEAMAFEDSRNGVVAARAAGLLVVATPSIYTEGDDLSGASLNLPSLEGFDPACLAGQIREAGREMAP